MGTTQKRRILSFLMALLVVVTTVFGHTDYNTRAAETAETPTAAETAALETTVQAEEPKTPETQVQAEEPKVPETTVQAEEPKMPETQVPAEEPKVPETQVQAEEPKVPETQVQAEEPKVPETQVPAEEPKVPETQIPAANEIAAYTSIADALAGADGTEFTVKGVVTLVDGKNIYVQDETGGICIRFGTAPADISLGDTISGTGKKGGFNGLPQLSGTVYEKLSGMTLTAKETAIGALTAADVCTYVQLKGLYVTEVYDGNGKYTLPNLTLTDGTNTIQIYKAVVNKSNGTDWDVKTGDKVDVKAAVGINNGTLQLRTTDASEIMVIPAPVYDNIADALAGADGTEFTVKGVVTLVDGKNIYVQDETGGICIRFKTAPADISLGDTISGTGKKGGFNGLPQLSATAYEKSFGMTLTAKETTIGALTAADVCTYVQLKGIEITEVYDGNGKYTLPNLTLTDGTNTIQIYKAVVNKSNGTDWDVKTGDKVNVKAAVGINNGTLQLRTTDASEITVIPETTGELGRITSAEQFTTGTYVMMVDTGYAPSVLNGTYAEVVQPTVSGNLVTDTKGAVWTLTVEGDEVILTDSVLQSIAPKAGENKLEAGVYKWKWTFNAGSETFTFQNQEKTYTLASNEGYENKLRPYKNATAAGTKYHTEFCLYKVDPNQGGTQTELPPEGSKAVLYNVAAKGVLSAQDDNAESPSVQNVSATVADGKVTAANGGVVFEVQKNGAYYRFYNETYGYLCSKGNGNNAYYSMTVCEEADWSLEPLGGGFKIKSKTAKYNGTSAQYLEYFSGSYKTYSFYATNKDGSPADTTIYEFHFYPCENKNLTGGIVNEPTVVPGTILDAYVGVDYTFTFTVDAPFGVKEIAAFLGAKTLTVAEELGTYTVTIPKEEIKGDKLTVAVSGKDGKGVAISGEIVIPVKDEPVIFNVTPEAGSETGANKRPLLSAELVNTGENPDITMTLNGAAVAAVYKDGTVSYTPEADLADGRCSVTITVKRADGKEAAKTWAFTVGKAQYQLYFGQLHSHTTYSDGSGSLESALEYVKNLPDSANVDFVAFTDHSNYFDKSGAANPEAALYDMSLATEYSQQTWKSYKDTVANFNASQSEVVAIGGFEMTWSGGPGHINTFHTPGIVSRNNAVLNNKTKDAGMKAYYALLSQAEGADSLSQFNHPGSTFGTFTDFSYWDAVIDSRIYMVEVGNGEGQVGSGGYFPSYEYYTMALDKGWHVAPTNNQDNHKGKWGNANEARDVILTDDFSEEGLYQAIREMRMYATEDKNLEIYYTVNGHKLGSSLTEVPEKLDINVTVSDPDASDSISKVEVIVNSGKTAYIWDNPSELLKGELTCTLDPTYSYYYIRVTEGDGDLAVTAPVWVGEALKLGISSVACDTSTPVTGEELTLTTTLFNSEEADANVKALTYTMNGKEVIGTDTTGYTIGASDTLKVDFKYAPTVGKLTKITVTAVVEQNQVEYTFTMDISLDIQDASKLAYIGIDAAHYNEYVAGNYKDSMGNFGELAAGYSVRTVELKTEEELIAACANPKYKALILTAPSRRLAASWTDPKTYSAEELAAIKTFNENGGSVILSGWSDHYESPSKTGNNTGIPFKHMAETQNEILEALGSSLRISDDATYDDSYNGGQQYRLYFNTYGENFLTKGVEVDAEHPHDRLYTEVFSHYGGASVYAVGKDGKAVSVLPETVSPVVFGHSTTYSVDADADGLGGTAIPKYEYTKDDSRLLVMALEQMEGRGAVIVSGAAFMSNFEVQATIEDSGSEKNYANYKICENLVQYINPATITPIKEVQAQTEAGYKYTIEGIVASNASGYDKDTAFFDCIYVQDETGGVCCFPVAGEFKIGDKVRVTGTTEFYQGEMELQVSAIEAIGTGTVIPKEVSAAQVNDRSVLGQLITVKGTVVSFEKANGLVQTIMVKDAAGEICRVFIDGYITTAEDVKNLKEGCAITVTGLASYDDTFNAPDGPFPRIRIRNRADIICTEADTPVVPDTPDEPDKPVQPNKPDVPGGSSASEDDEEETKPAENKKPVINKKPVANKKPTADKKPADDKTDFIIPVEGTFAEKMDAVIEAMNEVSKGNTVIVRLLNAKESENSNVELKVFVTLNKHKEKNINLVIELSNKFKWTINSSSIDVSKWEEGLEYINFFAEITEKVVPEELFAEFKEAGSEVMELSLRHDGAFGFTGELDVPVGKEYAGKNITLYYFNEETNSLEKQESALADKDGYVCFTFTHASDYVMVVEADAGAGTDTVPEKGEEPAKVPVEEPVSVVPALVIILILLAAAVICFAYAYKSGKIGTKKNNK